MFDEMLASIRNAAAEREWDRDPETAGQELAIAKLDAADKAYARRLYEEACARIGVTPVPAK